MQSGESTSATERVCTALPSVLKTGDYILQVRSEAHRSAVMDVLSHQDDIARWTHVPFPYGDADYDHWLQLEDSHYVILENGRLLGAVGAGLDPEAHTAEVGYWLAPSARSKGIATLALCALCDALFEAGYERLFADVLVGNPQSERVLERAGFCFEGVMRSVYSPSCGLGEARRDQRRYSRLPTDAGKSISRDSLVVSIDNALTSFSELWSPHILGNVNDYEVRVAKVQGEHLWHAHVNTDEFFMVLSGVFSISLREKDGQREVVLNEGDFFVVPRGVEHRPRSRDGASILMFERQGTSSVGDYKGTVPEHIDATRGHTGETQST